MFSQDTDFDALLGHSLIQEYRDMLDETQGLGSEEAFLSSEIENPLDAVSGLSDLLPTDEDNFGEIPEMAGMAGMSEEEEPVEDPELVAADELQQAASAAELSQAFQERFRNKGR